MQNSKMLSEASHREKESNNGHVIYIDPLEDIRWDEFVQNHPLGWITHLSGWKKVLEESFSHMRGYYPAIADHTGNGIKAGLPLFYVKSWLTGRRLVSVPFGTLCDPLFFDNGDMERLMEEVFHLSKRLGVSNIEIRCFMSPQFCDGRFIDTSLFKHHYMDLQSDPEELKKSFHRTCVRQRISRAAKSNLTLVLGENSADLSGFYQLYVLTRKRVGLPPLPYKFLKALWETFYPSGKLQLLLAEYEDKPIAGLILFKWKNRVSAEFAASDDNYVSFSPNHFLFWEAIQLSFHEGYKIFDFGRTAENNRPLMDFKNHWGTTVTDLPQWCHFEKTTPHKFTSDDSFLYKTIRKTCKIIPDPGLKLLGNLLYRHLS